MQGDWLLMLDTDHVFEPDLCARLLKLANECEVDVITGLYQFKHGHHSPVLYRFQEPASCPWGDWDREAKLFQVDGAGAGCLWVRRSVFQRLRAELGDGPFDITPPFGEDFSFFRRLATLGIPAYCAPAVECHHLRSAPVTLADYDPTGLAMDRYETEAYR
jgi:GT2 family glycosyltransferase